jgi:hypothetical protein
MIDEAIIDAYTESEQAGGFHAMIDQELAVPFETIDDGRGWLSSLTAIRSDIARVTHARSTSRGCSTFNAKATFRKDRRLNKPWLPTK